MDSVADSTTGVPSSGQSGLVGAPVASLPGLATGHGSTVGDELGSIDGLGLGSTLGPGSIDGLGSALELGSIDGLGLGSALGSGSTTTGGFDAGGSAGGTSTTAVAPASTATVVVAGISSAHAVVATIGSDNAMTSMLTKTASQRENRPCDIDLMTFPSLPARPVSPFTPRDLPAERGVTV